MIKVYVHPYSPFSQRVLFLLEELNLPYKAVPVWLEKGEQFSAGFRALNPASRVPVLVHNQFTLTESRSILRYLSDKTGAHELYPLNLEQRAETDQWMEFTGSHVGPAISSLAWENFWKPKFGMKPDPALQELFNSRIRRDMPVLEARLQNRKFLCGSRLTLADITAMPHIANFEMAKCDTEPAPAVLSWFQSLSKRKSWKKVAALASEMIPKNK